MSPNYYTVERQCSPIRTHGSPVWFRLTYRREWMAERGLWRGYVGEPGDHWQGVVALR